MKNQSIILLISLLLSTAALSAQDHQLEVNRFSKWGHQYLTVTNNWNGIYLTASEGDIPPVLAVITEINGQTTEGMSVQTFYKTFENGREATLTYLQKIDGKNISKKAVLTARQSYYIAGGVKKKTPLAKPNTINIAGDPDVDFFDFNTFDYKVEGDDPLTDRSILDEISDVFTGRGMRRDTQSPDLILTLQKTLQQSTNSVYVPETKTVVNTGSTTRMQKNIFTGKNYLATYQNNEIITSGGYTHTGVSATFHLVLTILHNQPVAEGQLPPVVWKLDYNKFSSSAIDIMNEARNGVSYWCLNYPFSEPKFSYSVETLGIVFASPNTVGSGEIVDVLRDTDAWKKGLRGGDKIVKGFEGGLFTFSVNLARRTFFKSDNDKKYFRYTAWFYCIPLPYTGGSKNLGRYNSDAYLRGTRKMGTCKLHYKIQHPNGTESEIKAKTSFQSSDFYFEYIY